MESVGVVGAENGPHGRLGGNHGLNVGCLVCTDGGTEGRRLAANHLNCERGNDECSNKSGSDGDRAASDLAG